MKRRHLLAAACLSLLAAVPLASRAQGGFPERPVTITVGFPVGSSTDTATRVIANELSSVLGQAVVVDNRPGASSSIAARSVAGADPDGYNLFVATIANAINANLDGPASFDVIKHYAPVAMMGSVPNVLVVHPTLDIASVEDLIRTAKAKPGELSYASSGVGTAPHLAGVLFNDTADINLLHVPYKGSSGAVTDLLAGRVSMMFGPGSTVLPHIQAGKLKAIASTGRQRSPVVPEVPTMIELGYDDFESSVWFGLVAPTGTPDEVRQKLADAVQTVLRSSEVQAQLKAQGIETVEMGPKAFGEYLRAETDRWGKVIRAAGVTLN